MKLNKPGVYRIIGPNFELLANVIGEVPCLEITSAISINALVQFGEFIILDKKSIEVQEVLTNPDKFEFLEYEYSEIASLPPYRQSIRGEKIPNLSNDLFNDFVKRFRMDRGLNREPSATKAYIMEKTGWSSSQANILYMKIAKIVVKSDRGYCIIHPNNLLSD